MPSYYYSAGLSNLYFLSWIPFVRCHAVPDNLSSLNWTIFLHILVLQIPRSHSWTISPVSLMSFRPCLVNSSLSLNNIAHLAQVTFILARPVGWYSPLKTLNFNLFWTVLAHLTSAQTYRAWSTPAQHFPNNDVLVFIEMGFMYSLSKSELRARLFFTSWL